MNNEFYNEALACRFTLPERITVRVHQQWLDARDEARAAGASSLLSLNWVSAAGIIEAWECEALPDYKAGLDDIADEQLAIINWVGSTVYARINELVSVPKN